MKSLYNYRIANNLNIDNIADFLDIDAQYYIDCENGDCDLSIHDLESLADLYGIDTYDFYDDNVVKNSILRYLFNPSNRTVVLTSDLKEIANFRKIVKAYNKLEKL